MESHEAVRPDPVPQRGGRPCPLVLERSRADRRASTRSRSWSSTTAPPTAPSRSPARTACAHFVRHTRNMGLARSFRDGVDYALAHGADIVVNTDGDNQYPQDRIADLVRPIVDGQRRHRHRATGRPPRSSTSRRSRSACSGSAARSSTRPPDTDLPDAASGFRAYSRASLMRLNVVTQFSYCMETIIQAGQQAAADRERAGRDQPEDPRVPAVQEHLAAHGQVGRGDHPQLPDVQAVHRASSRSARCSASSALIPFVRFAGAVAHRRGAAATSSR